MKRSDSTSTRGILHASAGQQKFALSRFDPGPRLRPFIEHYWAIRYDLGAETPYTQTVLSYPNINLAFEQDHSGRHASVYGVPRRLFVQELRGSGKVLGVKFRVGGFYPFWNRDVALLFGTRMAANEVFGLEADDWLSTVLDAGDDAAMAEQAERALLTQLPSIDDQAELAASLVHETMNNRAIIRVEQLCEHSGMSVRQLQRLFRKYVGVTPKWVIKQFRLQEAAQHLEQDESAHWAELAVQLGYFDQAHFIKDFKSVLGQSPTAYRNRSNL